MKINLKAFRHSIFLKLLAVIILAGTLTIIFFTIFFRVHFSSRIKEQFNVNIRNYFTYIAKEIGSPPDTSLASQIASKYSIGIKYHSQKLYWNSEELKQPKRKGFIDKFLDLIKDREFVVVNPDGSRFIFDSDFHRTLHPRPQEIIILIGALIGVMFLSYKLVKKILNPIKLLSNGVAEVSKGNFSHRIHVSTNDELSSLSDSFNEMTSRIKDMISARDQLLLDVSHELRTPITRVKLALEFLENSKSKESISADVKEIEMMITEILETERVRGITGNLKLETNDLVQLINEIVNYYSKEFPGITIENIPETFPFTFNYEWLKIAIKNIIENALKYSTPQSKPISVSFNSDKEFVELKVKDDGIGIPDADLPFVFEPFYRADRSRSKTIKGFGLGLSISKKIIEAHGGTIAVANNPGSGVTVLVRLKK